ncbi:hypothetical protein LPJ53_003797 [Coemansia erecta]|uniref:Galactose oxidase n=1 Tax=Coemansia erecta TaxID=147472 RepID=A0A9W7XVK8_9FUNG|nr:hypothetical protein LPJ53_003797 [Coemansia erecta]
MYLGYVGGLELTPRFQHTMEIVNGELCVFGGKSNSTGTALSDFLLDYRCVDVTTPIEQRRPNWKMQSSASRFAMPPLAQQSSVYDRGNHIIVPYGGQTPSTFSSANHLTVYCSQFQAWGASNILDGVPRRYLHTAVVQASSGDMIVFGGASDSTTNNMEAARWLNVNRMVLDKDRHVSHMRALGREVQGNVTVGSFNTDDGDPTPDAISSIIQHASVLINDTQMVVLGGSLNNHKASVAVDLPFNTVYVYDVDKLTWRSEDCTGDIPLPRSVFAASLHKNSIYIHAGVNTSDWSTYFDDLYELDTITWRWRKMPTADAPIKRYAHQMKTLGNYLIITHGFLENQTGDANIYFYDLTKEAFVSQYSPRGISNAELDVAWLVKATPATNGIMSVGYILVLLIFLIAVVYLTKEVFERSKERRIRARRSVAAANGGNGGIRSKITSYADNWRSSAYLFDSKRRATLVDDRRMSHDTDGVTLVPSAGGGRRQTAVFAKPSDGSNRLRSQSMSEGTSTIIEGEVAQQVRQQGTVPDNMRHTRVMDETPADLPYVTRRLTLSARIPAYRARRQSEGPTVRFSDYIPENNPIDDDDDDGHKNGEPYEEYDARSSFSSISIERQFELSAIAEHPDSSSTDDRADENGDENDGDEAGGLRIVNDTKQ